MRRTTSSTFISGVPRSLVSAWDSPRQPQLLTPRCYGALTLASHLTHLGKPRRRLITQRRRSTRGLSTPCTPRAEAEAHSCSNASQRHGGAGVRVSCRTRRLTNNRHKVCGGQQEHLRARGWRAYLALGPQSL